jgi:hypothetical protein
VDPIGNCRPVGLHACVLFSLPTTEAAQPAAQLQACMQGSKTVVFAARARCSSCQYCTTVSAAAATAFWLQLQPLPNAPTVMYAVQMKNRSKMF